MQDIKTLANTLRNSLQQSGHDIPHVTALKAISNLSGHPSYQALLAMRSQGAVVREDASIAQARIAPQCASQADLLEAVRAAIPHLQGEVREKLHKAFESMREDVVLTCWGINDFQEEIIATTTERERRLALIDFYRYYEIQERDWGRLQDDIDRVVSERKPGSVVMRVRLGEQGDRTIDLDASVVYAASKEAGDVEEAIRDVAEIPSEEVIYSYEIADAGENDAKS